MVVKDFYCFTCNSEKHDVIVDSCSIDSIIVYCEKCNANTTHGVLCNGGTGKRYRCNDWDVDEVRKGIRWMGPHATQDSETVKDNKTGEIYEHHKKYSSDIREERRAAWESKRRAQKVGPKIFMDMKF